MFFLEKKKKVVVGVVIFLSVLAALKTVFVGLNVDEEYQITMGYRLLRGEKMFVDIWDPHQTSAFLTEFLMWIYGILFSKMSGVIVWVRVWGCAIHFFAAWMMYKVVKTFLTPEYAFYLAALYFNLLPKNSILPDYSIMLIWSLTFLLSHLFFLVYKQKIYHSILCGVWMCMMVLAYPSAVLLFPVILVFFLKNKNIRWYNSVLFLVVCAAGGSLYLIYVSHLTGSVDNFIGLVADMLRGHSNYTDLTVLYKISHYAKEFLLGFLLCGLYCLLAKIVLIILSRITKKHSSIVQFMFLSLTIGMIHHVFHWILMLWKYEHAYNYALYFLIVSFAIVTLKKLDMPQKRFVHITIVLSVVELISVLLLTDLTVFASAKYMIPGIVIGIFAILKFAEGIDTENYKRLSRPFLLFMCLVAVFVKIWQYPGSAGVMFNVSSVRGIVKEGPAKGILAEYMTSYITSCSYEEILGLVPEGSALLIVDNSSLGYMYEDVTVSSYTTICDAAYNDILLEYWDRHPEKYPDIIAVSCWYGQLHWDSNSWIMKWIENEYRASQIIDGKYYRYYIR